ncbi:tripartite tricarboxylate transporter substrate binding protein [Allopusillimonas soli]|uniref:Tripartite tricarboxylate transporter substrate binding protein n=1 Tax=Allopusillimonas soli TaxID=659016 RepID=A0A853FI30_9BURK|nr:tripartite tricarboxylate transporter substrate binding protein [Allopusillimonas soli]NYT38430.1 tripartite tricarboxylate transporter substrate binding protein [Allopusillimonas soli]TEA72013.1 tripartite tricarboxylate transporter substrate binding protein [Allopusillimonas soli]
MKNRKPQLAAFLALALPAIFMSAPSQAASYPEKPVTIIVPFSPGGVVDTITRIIGDKLSARYGQPVVVENKAGAGGTIGTGYVAHAPADGYTLLSVSPGHAVAPSLYKNLGWNPIRDFRAVEGFGIVPNVFVVPPSVPAKNMAELIEMARKSDTPLTYATAGIGTSNHLSGALLSEMAHIKLEQVPYRGQPLALNDLLADRVTMMPLTIALAKPRIESGKLRPLAVTTAQRATALPDIPTVAEAANLPDYAVGTWFGFVARKQVPDDIIDKLSKDIAETLAMPEVKEKLTGIGLQIQPQNPQEFDAYIDAEYKKWSRVLKQAGIKPQ